MTRRFVRLLLALALATACGGRSREAEMGQSAAAGSSGADSSGADTCAAGKDTYQQRRDDVLQTAAASGCRQDADCATFYESNACLANCGTPLPAAAIDAARVQLFDFAKAVCSTCPPIFEPPCVPPRPLQCIQGRCSEGP